MENDHKHIIELRYPKHTVATLDPWSQIAIMLIGALGFISAFAWNGAIESFLDYRFGKARNPKIHLFYAVIVTIFAGIMIYFIVKYTDVLIKKQTQEEEDEIIEGMSLGNTLNFAQHIQPLFRESDIVSMIPLGIDLGSYADVKKRAHDIYGRLKEGAMPCDGGWDEEKVDLFKEWIDTGMRE